MYLIRLEKCCKMMQTAESADAALVLSWHVHSCMAVPGHLSQMVCNLTLPSVIQLSTSRSCSLQRKALGFGQVSFGCMHSKRTNSSQ